MPSHITRSPSTGYYFGMTRLRYGFNSSFRLLAALIVYGAIFFEVMLYTLSLEGNGATLWIILAAQTIQILLYPSVGALTTILSIAYFTLFLFPSIGLILYDGILPLQSVSAFIISFDFLRTFARPHWKNSHPTHLITTRRAIFLFLLRKSG